MSAVYPFKKSHSSSEPRMIEEIDADHSQSVPMRTALGDKSLRDPLDPLPRKLRALLSAVDNRAKCEVYYKSLTAFGDVRSMFDALEDIGMIRMSVSNAPTSSPVDAVQFLAEDNSLERLLANERESRVETPVRAPAPPPLNRRAEDPFNKFHSAQSAVASPAAVSVVAKVEKIKMKMTDFVLSSLPSQAMELTLAIDSIRTIDDLRESFPEYEKLVSRTGSAGVAHINTIKALLS